jgi:eukaryotic-like serine/threonine-protein kinase
MWISDKTLSHLCSIAAWPDISGTKYRIVSEIGRGGMGVVYDVEDPSLQRRVALKVLDLPDSSAELSQRLLVEGRVLAQLEHPGIVPVHDVGSLPDGRLFYTMKLVQGDRLDRHVDRVRFPERLRLFERICEPVAFAHSRGILHRDLKPQNVMVGPFGEVLVIDWGVAKSVSEPGFFAPGRAAKGTTSVPPSEQTTAGGTRDGTVIGTPGYMAPEQARGEAGIDQRADVYALGAILKFMATRPCPKESADTSASIQPDSRRLTAIIAKAMSEDRSRRYATVLDLSADIARLLDGEAVSAYPENWLRRTERLAAKHRTAVIMVLAYLAMRLILLFSLKR